MLVELLLTALIGAVIVGVIFLSFFNTQETPQDSQQKKKKSKKKRKKNQPKNKNKKGGNIKQLMKTINAGKIKPKMDLSDSEHLVSVFRGHTADITGIAWHQSGKFLFSSAKDKFIYVWEQPKKAQITQQSMASVKAEDKGYFCAVNTVVKREEQKTEAKKAEMKPEKIFGKYSNLENSIFACTNGSYGLNSYDIRHVSNNEKSRFRLQITANIQTEFILSKPLEDIKCICVSPLLTFICVSGSANTKIYFYDILKKQKQSNPKRIKLSLAPQNKTELRKVCDTIDRTLETIDGGQFINYEMNVSFDGQWLSIGTFKKDIRLWKINYVKPGKRDMDRSLRFGGTQLMCSLTNAHLKSIVCVSFSCDSKFMISASKDGFVKVWDICDCDYARGNKPEMILESDLGIGAIEKLVISYEFDIIAVLNAELQMIWIYKMKYAKKKIKLHCKFDNLFCRADGKGRVNCVKFSPDSQYIAVGTNDFDVRVYKIPAHKNKSSK